MKFLFYTHSLVSDWNHGNAHFLRGIMRELTRRHHAALALEPEESWSRSNLLADQGPRAVDKFHELFPQLRSKIYGPHFDHEAAIAEADVVVVHEWTEPALVERIGRARRSGANFTLLFHDTQRYLQAGWGRSVFTWHEAADDVLFRPQTKIEKTGDLIWVGNWGDGERSAELMEFLVHPAHELGLRATVRGVRYPERALDALGAAGIAYGGWIANAEAPLAFANNKVTVHIPRRPYVENLPGIPTIRVFEALACGIPLICAPWHDAEGLFRPGRDYLVAENGQEMTRLLREVLTDDALAAALVESGLETIRARHTCRHRVDELLSILKQCGTAGVVGQLPTKEAAE
jgi:spore maturation protein CgeB